MLYQTYIQKTKLNSTSIVYIKMISISPVALDRDAMAPVIFFTGYIYNHRKDVLMSKWNTYKHTQDSGTIFLQMME